MTGVARAGLVYFAIVFAAGFALGTIRVLFFVPRFGEGAAEIGEAPVMLLLAVLAARWVVGRFRIAPTVGSRLPVGMIALTLLLAAELLVVLLARGMSLGEYVASRDPLAGSVYLASLMLFALMPWLVGGPESGYRRGMAFQPQRVAVVGATGPTGIHLVRELVGRGRSVVAVSRRRERLEELFAAGGVDIAAADALDAEALGRAVEGCELVVDGIGLPPDRMDDHPRTARSIAAAARTAGARCLQISSYWAFFPHEGEVVSEANPRRGGHRWFRMRREAEDVMLAAGAAVVHLPDFFGPHVHTSSVQMALEEAAAGKPMGWLGRSDTARETAYVPDAMRIVADLAELDESYGTDWALPGCGVVSGDNLAELASRHLGRPVGVRAAPGWLLGALALVNPAIRQIRPMIPHYARAVRYDASKLRAHLGDVETTPLEQAVATTLDWIARARR